MTDIKIPEPHKGPAPRCPLCFAQFAREEVPSRRLRILNMIKDANFQYEKAKDSRDKNRIKAAKEWGEALETSLNSGAAEAFLCHFCKIAISCNDPFIGKWEEAYSNGEKIFCPAPQCGYEMRFFCTSTGYMQAKCPVKKCGAKVETSEPDRKKQDKELHTLFDDKGNKIALPGVDRPIASPQELSAGQIGQSVDDPNVPQEVFVPLPPKEGHA